MSKLKRMKRKRELQKRTNIREMSMKKDLKQTLGSHKLQEKMTKGHLDVLQNIEFILVTGYRDDGYIDDRTVADALKAAIHCDEPEDPRAISLNERLEDIRELRSDVTDDVWRDCLRVVLQSVHRHSSLKPGCRWYLDFVSGFIL